MSVGIFTLSVFCGVHNGVDISIFYCSTCGISKTLIQRVRRMLARYSFAILQLTWFFHHYHRSMTLGGLLGRPDRVVYGAFACFDCCCAGAVDGCSGPGAGFLLSSSGRLLVGDALVVAGLAILRMWTQFWVNWRCRSSWRMLSSGCGLVSFVGMFDMAFLPVGISMGLESLDEMSVDQGQG